MPELPEVETIAQSLRNGTPDQPSIIKDRIDKTKLFWRRTLAEPLPAQANRSVRGRTIRVIARRAKFLIMELDDVSLLFHLRMSGDLVIRHGDAPVDKHDRFILWLSGENGERQLAFNDARKFGRVWITNEPERILGGLGPEPLDERLGTEEFYVMLNHHRRQLKPLLMDQGFLSGLGNIYTDEALHLAGLHPLRNSNDITPKESERLLVAIRAILREGIDRNGASIDWVYRGGEFQNHFRVYGRTGKPCQVCGRPITRLLVGQRGTHICEHCQPYG